MTEQCDLIVNFFCIASAAHLQGRELVSSESFTWLREHFNTALSHCKPVADELMLNGVTHLFLHGSTYSPAEDPWPGFKFYASVNFHPSNSIWHDAPYLFEYIRRCQYILQQTETIHQVLLYWPFHDVLTSAGNEDLLLQLSIHNVEDWLVNTSFYHLAGQLDSLGIGYDVLSDRFLEETEFYRGLLNEGGKSVYRAIVVPDMNCMPVESMEKLLKLKNAGARIIFQGLPETVPGLYRYREREDQLKGLINNFEPALVSGNEIKKELDRAGIIGEKDLKQSSLKFLKKSLNGMAVYFLVNHTPETIDKWIIFKSGSELAILYNPMNGRPGLAASRSLGNSTEVRLFIRPGEALFLFMDNQVRSQKEYKELMINEDVKTLFEPWKYPVSEQPANAEFGPWKVMFSKGGPTLPEMLTMDQAGPWTGYGDNYDAFAGTAIYSTSFKPGNFDPEKERIWIELEDLRESARIRINGKDAGALIAHPFRIDITDHLKKGNNRIEIEVTNVSANRIRALERSGREWKKFYDINMVNINYLPLETTNWAVQSSGLKGEVTLWRVKYENGLPH